jgi:hypothetical protein
MAVIIQIMAPAISAGGRQADWSARTAPFRCAGQPEPGDGAAGQGRLPSPGQRGL